MKRREFYKLIASLVEQAESPRALLDEAAVAMRQLRGLSDGGADCNGLLKSALFPTLKQDDALGQIYQALNAPALERASGATARERRKFTDDEIPSVTQLFTPRFVVEFLLHNTLGRLWRAMHPETKIPFDFLVSTNASVPAKLLRHIKILDPACGTMNFGLVAIEMLDAMYREEMELFGSSASVRRIDEIPDAIIDHNLFGIDIDPVALDLAAQTLAMKLHLPVERCRANLWRGDALLEDDLVRRCAGAFDIVLTNPPFLSARNLDPARVKQIKKRFPLSWRDACACFVEQSLCFASERGSVGVLSMQSFMFTGAFQKLRENLAKATAIDAIAHFGPSLFEVGNPGTLQTAAIVLRKESDERLRNENETVAIRLTDLEDKRAGLRDACSQLKYCRVSQGDLTRSPRSAWVYWLSPSMRRAFREFPRLKEIAEPRQGLATTDNARFVRYWWEVEPTRADAPCRASRDTWFPYVKSGRFRRWYEAPRHRVNWADDGREIKQSIVERYPYLNGRWEWVAKNSQFYGRAGVTYSYLTAGAFSARLMPAGAIFDVAGSAIFPQDPLALLAILNSSTANELLHAVNPTVNFQVGDLAELPIPAAYDDRLASLAARAVELQRAHDQHDETSPEFVSPAPWDTKKGNGELANIERQIDRAVAELYRVDAPASRDDCTEMHRLELARRWVSFAIGRLLGRWGCEREFRLLQIRTVHDASIARLRAELQQLLDAHAATQIEDAIGGLSRFVSGPFYPWHVKLYRSRPVYWALGDRHRASLVLHDFATRECIERLVEVRNGWERNVNDGVLKDLAPFADSLVDVALARKLREICDAHAG